MRMASAMTYSSARLLSCTVRLLPVMVKTPGPRSCQSAPAELKPAGASSWLTANVPRLAPAAAVPSSTVQGALVARLGYGDQVAETRYWPCGGDCTVRHWDVATGKELR